MTYAPAKRASCVTIDPTAPAAPCAMMLCPARRRPCSNSPCHAVRPEIGRPPPPAQLTRARQRREVACSDGRVLGQGAVAIPVREAEHPLSDREPRGAITEGGDHSGQLVSGDRGRSVTVEAIGPGRRPTQLSVNESRGMNLNDNVVDRWLRLRPLRQLHPGRSRSLVRHHYRLHLSPPCVAYSAPQPAGPTLARCRGRRRKRWGSWHRLDSSKAYRKVTYCPRVLPNGSRFSCGAPKKDSFHNLRVPPASSACEAAIGQDPTSGSTSWIFL